jgi:tetratricopeptide (TPR) repeat protein
MILAGMVAVVFWVYCGMMSLVARSERAFLQSSAVHAVSVAAYLALAASVAGTCIGIRGAHPIMTVPAFALILIVGVVLGHRYVAFLIAEYMDRAHASLTGISGMTVKKTYDVAEKAEHEGDLDRALSLYADEAAKDPADAEPPRRMGEIHLRRGKVSEAIEHFRRALPLVREPDPHSTLAFRLADLLEKEGRAEESRSVLTSIAAQHAGTRYADYARQRLAAQK